MSQQTLSRKLTSVAVAVFSTTVWNDSIHVDGQPVFQMGFSSIPDVSGNDLAIEPSDAVSPSLGAKPTRGHGRTLDAARWEGEDDDTNQIIVFDHSLLDAVSVRAGSIATWIKVDDDMEWNNIAKICASIVSNHTMP